MPNGETGLALEKWIRRHHPGIKILLTSGYPQMLDDIADLQEPIVQKPYNYVALWHRFERLFCVPDSAWGSVGGAVVARGSTPANVAQARWL
jgi:hypothetical protein